MSSIDEYTMRSLEAAWAQRITELEVENRRILHAAQLQQHDIQQTLGQALGYPWFKDDQKNFPGATEADGVCVGEHVAETLAVEIVGVTERLRAALAEKDAAMDWITEFCNSLGIGIKTDAWLKARKAGHE